MGTRGFSKGFSEGFLHARQATLSALEAPDTALFDTALRDVVALSATEAVDSAPFTVTLRDEAALLATEAADQTQFLIASSFVVLLHATEAQDQASFAVTLRDVAVLEAAEAPDQVSVSAQSGAQIIVIPPGGGGVRGAFPIPTSVRKRSQLVLRAIEAPDLAFFRTTSRGTVALAAVEAEDEARLTVGARRYVSRLSALEPEDRFSAETLDFDVTQHNMTLMMAA